METLAKRIREKRTFDFNTLAEFIGQVDNTARTLSVPIPLTVDGQWERNKDGTITRYSLTSVDFTDARMLVYASVFDPHTKTPAKFEVDDYFGNDDTNERLPDGNLTDVEKERNRAIVAERLEQYAGYYRAQPQVETHPANIGAQKVEPAKAKRGPVVSLPPGTTWPQIRVRFRNGETVGVHAEGKHVGDYTHAELGMAKSIGKKPTEQWKLLKHFAESQGNELLKRDYTQRDKLAKRVEVLRNNLQCVFGIPGDPIVTLDRDPRRNTGWKLEFVLEPEREDM